MQKYKNYTRQVIRHPSHEFPVAIKFYFGTRTNLSFTVDNKVQNI